MGIDERPAVSVLLPVYNAQAYLAEAIESVLTQSFTDFELLAFDDGSSDASLDILHRYEAGDRRVRVFTRENRGLVATLNELIGLARGRYLARMDADDVCLPDRFARQVTFLDNHPDHLVVGGWYEMINAQGDPIGIVRSPTDHAAIDEANIAGHTSICHPTAMIRRTAIATSNWYDQQHFAAEDLDLWLRIAEVGKVANIADLVLRYRMHDGSISEAKGALQQAVMYAVCKSARARRGIADTFENPAHWRPDAGRASRHDFAIRYGWTAWSHGYRQTWWHYARQAIRLDPLSAESWKLMIAGLLKRPGRAGADE